VRQAVAAEDMMQAFFYRHLVPESELKLAVRRGAAFRTPPRGGARGPAGNTGRGRRRLRVEARFRPIAHRKVTVRVERSAGGDRDSEDDAESGRRGDRSAMRRREGQAWLQGNLIVDISGERTPPAANGRPAGARQRVPLGTLPAVPFEIVSGATTTAMR
jgi:hypothetical protein